MAQVTSKRMKMRQITVNRTAHRFLPDPRRVIAKPYLPGEETYAPGGKSRVKQVMERILTLPEAEIGGILDRVLGDFSHRYRDFRQILEHNFQLVAHHLPSPAPSEVPPSEVPPSGPSPRESPLPDPLAR